MIKKSFLLIFLVFIFFPHGVLAHAMLEHAFPAPDSQLSSSPSDITLTFNERLERELFYIKVFNNQGESVTQNSTEMSLDQKQMHLPLPPLSDGIYTVTYRVISADGHPIQGSYVISVGESALSDQPVHVDLVEHDQELRSQLSIFGIRIFYFLSLLLIAGWIAWSIYFRFKSGAMDHRYQLWTSHLQKVYLVALCTMIFLQLRELLTDWGLSEITAFFFKTSTGMSLTISLFLSIFGFIILLRNKWVDMLWVTFLLAAKSINGHAMAVDPPAGTVLLDLIHLLAASIWASGLLYLFVFWKRHQDSIMIFIPVFSKAALVCMIILSITGTLSTIIFLPKLSYLLDTTWGILLLVKVALVALVIVVGAILRKQIKQSMQQLNTWLKLDLVLMILITGIVGVFTFLSPSPPNHPLNWHEMRASTHMMTAQITPNVPGTNHFSVTVSLMNPEVQIKQVELFLSYQDDLDIAPIKVPLTAEPGQNRSLEYHFKSDGPYLPFPGSWTAEIRIMDSDDNETVYTKEFTIYQTK